MVVVIVVVEVVEEDNVLVELVTITVVVVLVVVEVVVAVVLFSCSHQRSMLFESMLEILSETDTPPAVCWTSAVSCCVAFTSVTF